MLTLALSLITTDGSTAPKIHGIRIPLVLGRVAMRRKRLWCGMLYSVHHVWVSVREHE